MCLIHPEYLDPHAKVAVRVIDIDLSGPTVTGFEFHISIFYHVCQRARILVGQRWLHTLRYLSNEVVLPGDVIAPILLDFGHFVIIVK